MGLRGSRGPSGGPQRSGAGVRSMTGPCWVQTESFFEVENCACHTRPVASTAIRLPVPREACGKSRWKVEHVLELLNAMADAPRTPYGL